MRKTPIGVILLTLFLDLVGFSIVFPMFAELLSFYGGQQGGLLAELNRGLASLFDIEDPRRHAAFFGGVLAGLYSVLQFLVTPVWGGLSDRIGRRPVLLASVVLNLLGYVIWMFSGSFELFVVSRVVAGLASGNIGVASAAVADVSDRAGRARAMGLMGAAIGMGFLIGPALGSTYAFLPRLDSGDATGFALNPFSFPAAIAAALALINVVWLARRFKETLPEERRGAPGTVRTANVLRLFSRTLGPGIPVLNLAYLAFMIGFAGFEGTLVFLAADCLGWGPGTVGLCMVWLGFCSAFIQGGVVRRVVARTGERKLALMGLILLVPGYALTGMVAWHPSPAFLWIGVTLLAGGVGFLSPTLSTLVSLRADASSQGRVLGSYRSVGALGRALGPFLAAGLYFGFGAGAPYVCGAVLGVIPLFLVASATRGSDPHAAAEKKS